MRQNNIAMLDDTLQICRSGIYHFGEKTITLRLGMQQMEEAVVALPEDIEQIRHMKTEEKLYSIEACEFGCENMDSFSLARKRCHDMSDLFGRNDAKEILVLNLANSVHPGGGVRSGARAQEEDLCRQSSLLLSLESKAAAPYYSYNRAKHTRMGSDAVILSPKVEIIKDEKGAPLNFTVIVAVMSCAAPDLRNGMEGMSMDAYSEMVRHRINGMLTCAAHWGYRYLVLGAFGCGAFRNDAHIVADLFYREITHFRMNGMTYNDLFRRIDFAVLDRSEDQYNFHEFHDRFIV